MKAFTYLVFPNSVLSVLPEGSLQVEGEPTEHGIITSVTQGSMSGIWTISIILIMDNFLAFTWCNQCLLSLHPFLIPVILQYIQSDASISHPTPLN